MIVFLLVVIALVLLFGRAFVLGLFALALTAGLALAALAVVALAVVALFAVPHDVMVRVVTIAVMGAAGLWWIVRSE